MFTIFRESNWKRKKIKRRYFSTVKDNQPEKVENCHFRFNKEENKFKKILMQEPKLLFFLS